MRITEQTKCVNDATRRTLGTLTPLTALSAVCFMFAAMATNEWLHTKEKIPVQNANGTIAVDDRYKTKQTTSGMWRICATKPGDVVFHCKSIEYFPEEEYSPDINDSTNSLPYAMRRAAMFYLLSAFLLFTAELSYLIGHAARAHRMITLIAGCMFILSGLSMLVGLVIYIATFKSEVGGKLQPLSALQPPLFEYHYGFSFWFMVLGFMTTELTGTLSVFFYIHCEEMERWEKSGQDDRKNAGDYGLGGVFGPVGKGPSHARAHYFGGQQIPFNAIPNLFACSNSANHMTRSTSAYSYRDDVVDHLPTCRRSHQYQRQFGSGRHPNGSNGGANGNPYDYTGGGRGGSRSIPNAIHQAESMKDLSFYSFPSSVGLPRDITCNTVSTAADSASYRGYSREFSMETLRRTTPV